MKREKEEKYKRDREKTAKNTRDTKFYGFKVNIRVYPTLLICALTFRMLKVKVCKYINNNLLSFQILIS